YSAGDFFDRLRERRIAICNASSVFDDPCAQHVMAMLLALARGLPHAMFDQPKQIWDTAAHRRRSFLLDGQKVLLVGYGAIARRLAEMMTPYHFDILAFRRSVRGD